MSDIPAELDQGWNDESDTPWYNDRLFIGVLSKEAVDKEGDLIELDGLEPHMAWYIEHGTINYYHRAINIGRPLAWKRVGDEIHIKAGCHDGNTRYDNIWNEIKAYNNQGNLSLHGEPLKAEVVCDGKKCWNNVTETMLWEASWCGSHPQNDGSHILWVNEMAKGTCDDCVEKFLADPEFEPTDDRTKLEAAKALCGYIQKADLPGKIEAALKKAVEHVQKAVVNSSGDEFNEDVELRNWDFFLDRRVDYGEFIEFIQNQASAGNYPEWDDASSDDHIELIETFNTQMENAKDNITEQHIKDGDNMTNTELAEDLKTLRKSLVNTTHIDTLRKAGSRLKKGRRYLKPGETPQGANIQTGARGGRYVEGPGGHTPDATGPHGAGQGPGGGRGDGSGMTPADDDGVTPEEQDAIDWELSIRQQPELDMATYDKVIEHMEETDLAELERFEDWLEDNGYSIGEFEAWTTSNRRRGMGVYLKEEGINSEDFTAEEITETPTEEEDDEITPEEQYAIDWQIWVRDQPEIDPATYDKMIEHMEADPDEEYEFEDWLDTNGFTLDEFEGWSGSERRRGMGVYIKESEEERIRFSKNP